MQVLPQVAPKTSRSDWQQIVESVARNFSTEEFAAQLKIKTQTVRAGYCRDGHYCGITPIKLANRRLLWPADKVADLLAGRPAKAPDAAIITAHLERKAADQSRIPAHIREKSAAAAARLAAASASEDAR